MDADDDRALAADEAHHRARLDAEQRATSADDRAEQRVQRLVPGHEHGDAEQRRLLLDHLDVLDTPDQHPGVSRVGVTRRKC